MNVIVDTVIWSFAFRRQPTDSVYSSILADLIRDGRAVLLGAVRQEVLSGIRHVAQFERLKHALQAFPDVVMNLQDYELAAEYYNFCRGRGVQGANTDFLICSAAVNRNFEILTTDQDFGQFATVLPIVLYQPIV